MHLATRADALYDLLSDVTAFVEVQGLHLLGLLGQVTVAYVLAVMWNPVYDAPQLQCFCSHRLCSSMDQLVPDALGRAARRPDFIPARFVLRTPDDHATSADFVNFHPLH